MSSETSGHRRVVPASRTLWVATVGVVLTFTVLRVLTAALTDLRSDEAYYWTWAFQPALSFLDQPPAVAYFVRLGIAIFGDTTLGARFANLLSLPLIELALADIARRRSGTMTAALMTVLALESTVNFGLVSTIVEPSIPLLLFASLLFWTLCRLDETRDPRWWLAAGLFGGLALDAKYTALLFVPGVLAFVLLTTRNRLWLRSGWLWAGGGVALVAFLPVLVWNGSHDWASFRFQGVRVAGGEAPEVGGLISYLGTNIAFSGPLLAIVVALVSVAALFRSGRRGDALTFALSLAFLIPFAYLGVRSLSVSVNPSWAIMMWPFGIVAFAITLYRNRSPDLLASIARLVTAGTIAVGMLLVAALFYHALWDSSVWLGRRDPVGGDTGGYDAAAREILDRAGSEGATWIATSDYRTYATLKWLIGDEIAVVQVNERSRFLDFAPIDTSAIDGRPGLYVTVEGGGKAMVEAAIAGLSRPAGTVERRWRGYLMDTLQLTRIDGWTPELDPPPGSPFYAWPVID